MPRILRNAIRTPDGTVLESTHRHDFICHKDKKTKKRYCVDGGYDYIKRTGDAFDYEELSVFENAVNIQDVHVRSDLEEGEG